MYVLHYDHSDYEEHESQVIAVSEDKAKLEAEIERLMAPSRDFSRRLTEHQKSRDEHIAKGQKTVRKWLKDNVDAVREIRPQMFNGEFYVKDFHTLANTPYHPDVKKREQEKAIDMLVTSHFILFFQGGDPSGRLADEFLNMELCKTPLPVIPKRDEEFPKMESGFAFYHEGGFKIEEVKVL